MILILNQTVDDNYYIDVFFEEVKNLSTHLSGFYLFINKEKEYYEYGNMKHIGYSLMENEVGKWNYCPKTKKGDVYNTKYFL